jgi:hypothetical protein
MSSFYVSIYVDENGEDVTRISNGKHRPLYLELSRYKQLQHIVNINSIGHVVSSFRSSSDGWIPMDLI